jgi:hypothetical protein
MRSFFLVILIAASWPDALAQSSLPPCPTDRSTVWTNCAGSFFFSNGDWYIGLYRDGNFDGTGIYTYADGERYIGSFARGEKSGRGKLISSNGNTLIEGTWTGRADVVMSGVNWHIVSNEADGIRMLVSPDSIRLRNGNRVAWHMRALAAPEFNGVLSDRILSEFDCREGRLRVLQYSGYSGPHGTGKVVRSLDPSPDWDYQAPGTVGDSTLRYVCDYKISSGNTGARN